MTNSVVRLLADYELHHSDSDSNAPAPNPRSETQSENPEWWPNDHRRIPDYRPINRELVGEMRPAGTNMAEAWFITTMLSGVTINAVSISGPRMSFEHDLTVYSILQGSGAKQAVKSIRRSSDILLVVRGRVDLPMCFAS